MTENTPTFLDWLRKRIGRNWVIARRSKYIVARYGNDVVTLSSKQYAELQSEYETETSLDVLGGPSKAVIDRAVNCHDELVAALKAAVMGEHHTYCPHRRATGSCTCHIVKGSAALAKAAL